MTSSDGNFFRVTGLCAGNSPVTAEFPAQRPVMQSCEIFVDLRLNKRLSKLWSWWFEMPLPSLWRHCNAAWQNRAADHQQPRFWSSSPVIFCPQCHKVWAIHCPLDCLAYILNAQLSSSFQLLVASSLFINFMNAFAFQILIRVMASGWYPRVSLLL